MNDFTSPVRNLLIFVAKFLIVLFLFVLVCKITNNDVNWTLGWCISVAVALWDRIYLAVSLLFFEVDIAKTNEELDKAVDGLKDYDVSKMTPVAIVKRKIKK